MSNPELRRTLGLTSAISIVVGGVIGTGIFLKPLSVSQSVPSHAGIFAIWTLLGVICLFGAFAYAELGTVFPEAGGQYAFLREGFGRFIAFLYGWCLFFVINTGTLAALAVAFADNLRAGLSLPEGRWIDGGLAVAMILLLAVVNHFGVGFGALLQNASTFAKLAALAAITFGGFFLVSGGGAAEAGAVAAAPSNGVSLNGLVAASVAIFWAYEGWYQLPFSSAEMKDPGRTVPRGLIYGTFLLMLIYVIVNLAYLNVVPLNEMRTLTHEVDVPTLAVERTLGGAASRVLALLIALSALGAANPCLLCTPRAFFAMAKDGLVPKAFMNVHPVYQTPTISIWLQALWSVALVVVLKTFKDITVYVIFAALLFYALTVATVIILRRKRPELPRPYRCLGYPVTPVIFILVVLFVDVITLADPAEQQNALYGLGIIALGAVAYLIFARRPA